MTATEPKPEDFEITFDAKDYEIACLKLRNAQMHHRIAVLEGELKTLKELNERLM